MCIYCNTDHYRKIYENHTGPIPKDECGRSYEVHHIDGNKKNNNPDNLVALSIREHYDVHYSQGDYGACLFIAQYRLNHSVEELSELARLNALKRVKNKTHPFLNGEMQSKMNLLRVSKGTHNLQRREDGTSVASERVVNGSHPFLGNENTKKQLAAGKHASQIIKTCNHCGKEIDAANFKRWHGDNCKLAINKKSSTL